MVTDFWTRACSKFVGPNVHCRVTMTPLANIASLNIQCTRRWPLTGIFCPRFLTKTNRMGSLGRSSIPANVAHWCTSCRTLLWGHRITWVPSPGTSTELRWWHKGRMCSLCELWKQLLDQNPQEALVSASLFGIPRAVQEFGLDHFKSNVTKTVKDFDCVLAELQGEACWDSKRGQREKERERTLATAEEAKDLVNKAATKQQQQQ